VECGSEITRPLPLASICFVGAMLWKLYEVPFINDVAPLHNRTLADVRENWVLEAPEAVAAPAETKAAPAPTPAHTTGNAPLTSATSAAFAAQEVAQ
jgi:hypothetical protein